jgi:hypothetical protein
MTTNLINQQSPPLELMKTLCCNTEVISLMLPLWPSLPLESSLSVLSKHLTFSLCIWKMSPPLTSMAKVTSRQDHSPWLNCPWGYSPWLKSPWDCSPKLNFSIYGASSCKSKTYKNIIKNSLWGKSYAKFLTKILKNFPWKRFCKDICNIFFGPNILNSNVILFNLFP